MPSVSPAANQHSNSHHSTVAVLVDCTVSETRLLQMRASERASSAEEGVVGRVNVASRPCDVVSE